MTTSFDWLGDDEAVTYWKAERTAARMRKDWLRGVSRYDHALHVVDFSAPGADTYDLPEDAPEEAIEEARRARAVTRDVSIANVFSSLIPPDVPPLSPDSLTVDEDRLMHTVAVDIDFPAVVVPSSTDGHSHLFIDKPITWAAYKKLLHALAEAGLVEEGYVGASERRGATHLRLPWCHKEES